MVKVINAVGSKANPPYSLQSAKYVYDGDGNMVKSVIISKLNNTTTTFYPGKHYNVEVKNGTQKVQKYYSAGSTIVAVRTVVNGTDTLQWTISDQIGSTSVTATPGGTPFATGSLRRRGWVLEQRDSLHGF